MGFAFHPGAIISNNPGQFVENFHENADLMVLHFGDKVPWSALEACKDLDDCEVGEQFTEVMDQLALHAQNFPGKVYVAVSALNNERNAIATDWDGSPAPNDSFASKTIRAGYKRWAAYVRQKFSPDYFSQGIEINMYAKANPGDFKNLLSLMSELESGSIGPTIQWEFYKEEWQKGNRDELQAMIAQWPGRGFAFSTYPQILDVPEGYNFAEYGIPVGERPIVISEAGIEAGKQGALLEKLLAIPNLEALVWFFKENDNKLLSQLPNEYPHTVFKNAGLQSPAWNAAFSCS